MLLILLELELDHDGARLAYSDEDVERDSGAGCPHSIMSPSNRASAYAGAWNVSALATGTGAVDGLDDSLLSRDSRLVNSSSDA